MKQLRQISSRMNALKKKQAAAKAKQGRND